ncbi:MAG: hydrogenobyrinic acid a,c-diamide synthase (glutamine-hydrolyzing) [Deltaproteobacteria bacterium]|nr:hydrogenobyrinic acid a,c-diamide synthase (glutamine-hydrolyzing) [Deltaproteobacteria bacterium]MBW2137296.1 hydrogenobyrinic acid a,c-diamide synthase (glutamine-hydrolyzing) [Deltaproteobacteria bacterium]
MIISQPRVIISALRGGSGKTILSLGIGANWSREGHRVAPFKKGPDFIDPGWLTLACGRTCHNLDPFMMSQEKVLNSFLEKSRGAEMSLIEGNRGLYDGMDLQGRYSTAEVAKLLNCPVVLIVDVTMATRTVAAMVMGCQKFDPGLDIAGVILNRVAGKRQGDLVRESIESYCQIPVLGEIPKLKGNFFPERHMGLVPPLERDRAGKAIEWAKRVVEDHLDLRRIREIANRAGPLKPQGTRPLWETETAPEADARDVPRIGYIRDKAFWFYYPENLAQLEGLGAELVEINSITSNDLPDIDALYIGGGFPEVQVDALASNSLFRHSLKGAVAKGLPLYAECGGMMYLGEGLILGDKHFPMVGALPLKFRLEKKPQGHGYTILRVQKRNLYFPEGDTLRGHEFHYSRPLMGDLEGVRLVFRVERGQGLGGSRDGLCTNNLLATYSHLHAIGYPAWARRFFEAALFFKRHIKPSGGLVGIL